MTETIPAEPRCWSVSWPQYTPADITPPELLPAALAHHVPDWAEGAATPADVHDWPLRQADALVPFQLDARGWPLHPQGRTGRTGRNLGKWGENAAADPIVVAGHGDDRRVLLITRDDIGVEAIPGGMCDPGETAPTTLARELREETGVDLSDHQPVILGRDLVDDWRTRTTHGSPPPVPCSSCPPRCAPSPPTTRWTPDGGPSAPSPSSTPRSARPDVSSTAPTGRFSSAPSTTSTGRNRPPGPADPLGLPGAPGRPHH